MADRRPLVRIGGETRQLPEGDRVLGDGGILVQAGASDGPALEAGLLVRALVPSDYVLDPVAGAWHLRCAPAGSIAIDLWLASTPDEAAPDVGDSILAGNYPAISSGVHATGGYADWTEHDIPRGAQLTAEVRSVSGGVSWFALMMEAKR
ncbi:MAG TPA: hypothetical protein VGK41_01190 [Solirubrobacterales bacterium]